jgi:hypothetical protein
MTKRLPRSAQYWTWDAYPGTEDPEDNPFVVAEGIPVAVVLCDLGIPDRLRIYNEDWERHCAQRRAEGKNDPSRDPRNPAPPWCPTWPPYGAIFAAIAERWPDNEVRWDRAFHGPWQPRDGYVEAKIKEP